MVCHRFEEVIVAGEAAHIFRRAGPHSPDKARVCSARDGIVDFIDLDHMVPAIAKVVNILDGLRANIFEDIQQAGFTGRPRNVVIVFRIWPTATSTEISMPSYLGPRPSKPRDYKDLFS